VIYSPPCERRKDVPALPTNGTDSFFFLHLYLLSLIHPAASHRRTGFTELCRLDGRFDAFAHKLFTRGACETNRELLDKDANQKLDVHLNGYLRLLSGFFLTPAAFKTLEYLVRRFKIHVYNVDAAITCALPYHSTPEFVKLVQLSNLEGSQFYFLKHVKEKGAAPPRDQLVVRCSHDGAFLSFVCQAAAASASTKVRAFAHRCHVARIRVLWRGTRCA
jgi:U3 small nucleolar RNA-associated protein 10